MNDYEWDSMLVQWMERSIYYTVNIVRRHAKNTVADANELIQKITWNNKHRTIVCILSHAVQATCDRDATTVRGLEVNCARTHYTSKWESLLCTHFTRRPPSPQISRTIECSNYPNRINSCKSVEDARTKIKDFMVPLQTFHASPSDYVIYRCQGDFRFSLIFSFLF